MRRKEERKMFNEDAFMSDLVLGMTKGELRSYSDAIEACESLEYKDRRKTMDKVVFYHQASCGQCRTIESLLNRSAIDYDSVMDIAEMQKRGILHTPTLEVNGELLTGKPMIDYINSRRGM